MKYLVLSLFLLANLLVAMPALAAPNKEKEALQALNEFIGSWKGNGKGKPGPDELWSEAMNWGWKFKGDEVALVITFKDAKYFKSGIMRYLVDNKKYQLTLKDSADKDLVYLGQFDKDNNLILERKDDDRKITQKLTMNTAAEGDRFLYESKIKKAGSTIYVKDFEVGFTREGVTLGKKVKRNECVVSGGLGTIPVSYKGENFFVCCTGCRDAFNENPEKYIKEYKARKKNQ